ncbi:MAG: hypothetical protein F6K39_07100 [Okeania sp. SIO3B3]|nr:hypothetical protein [Okeania sp. SIO3B3]
MFELYKLHKIDLFLIGIYTWIKINEVYPEVSPLSIINFKEDRKDVDIALFKAILKHNCMALILSFKNKITNSFQQKIYWSSLRYVSPSLSVKTLYKTKENYPLILFQIRVGRRVWSSQIEGIVEIITKLYSDFPNLGIILDGWTQKETGNLSQENSTIEQEMTVAHDILTRIPAEVTTHLIIGQTVREKVVWAEAIDLFVAPYGANCAIPLWVVNKPGIVHSNQELTTRVLRQSRKVSLFPIWMIPHQNITDINLHHIYTDYDFDSSIIYEQIKIMLPEIADSQSFDPINDFWDEFNLNNQP